MAAMVVPVATVLLAAEVAVMALMEAMAAEVATLTLAAEAAVVMELMAMVEMADLILTVAAVAEDIMAPAA